MGWGLDAGQYGIAVGDIDPLMAPGDRNVLGAGSSRFSPIQLHRAFHDLLGDCSSHPAGATQEDASGHGSAQTVNETTPSAIPDCVIARWSEFRRRPALSWLVSASNPERVVCRRRYFLGCAEGGNIPFSLR
jgi:hypothetical protein